MITGTLEIRLRLESAQSLKDKRKILHSLMEKARSQFHVAVAEVDDLELWNRATIGAACVSNNAVHAESVLQHIVDLVESHPLVEVLDVGRDILRT